MINFTFYKVTKHVISKNFMDGICKKMRPTRFNYLSFVLGKYVDVVIKT